MSSPCCSSCASSSRRLSPRRTKRQARQLVIRELDLPTLFLSLPLLRRPLLAQPPLHLDDSRLRQAGRVGVVGGGGGRGGAGAGGGKAAADDGVLSYVVEELALEGLLDLATGEEVGGLVAEALGVRTRGRGLRCAMDHLFFERERELRAWSSKYS